MAKKRLETEIIKEADSTVNNGTEINDVDNTNENISTETNNTENDSDGKVSDDVTDDTGKVIVKRPPPPSSFGFEYFQKQKVRKDDHEGLCLASAAKEILRNKNRLSEKHSEKEWRKIIGKLTGPVPVGGK